MQHAPACLLSARPPRGGSLLLRRRRSDALRCMQGLLFIPRHINERAASLLWVRYEHASSIDKTHYEQHVRRWTPSTKRPCAQAKDFWWDVNIPIRAWNISSIAKKLMPLFFCCIPSISTPSHLKPWCLYRLLLFELPAGRLVVLHCLPPRFLCQQRHQSRRLISSIKWLKHFEWQSKISYRSFVYRCHHGLTCNATFAFQFPTDCSSRICRPSSDSCGRKQGWPHQCGRNECHVEKHILSSTNCKRRSPVYHGKRLGHESRNRG